MGCINLPGLSMSEALQVWVRNDKGQVYGPLSPPSVELLIDNGVIAGRLQVSTNGMDYMFPGRVPGLRMIFPKESWGDTVVPGDELDAQWSQVQMPAALGAVAPASTPSGLHAAPVAGPGVPRAPVAGPGVRQQQAPRPMSPAQLNAQGRASSPSMAGVPRSSPSVADFMAGPRSSPSMTAAAPSPSSASMAGVARSSPSMATVAPAPSSPSMGGVPQSSPSVADFMKAAAPPAAVAPKPVTNSSDANMPTSGALQEHSPQQLYYLAGGFELTGLLKLQLSDRELAVHFKRGNPEFIDSTHPDDALGAFLVAQRVATAEQISQAQREAGRFGGELLPALFGLGLVNPNAVFGHLGQRASSLLLRVLSAEVGTFTFEAIELPPAKAMPLGNRWAVYLEALRKLPFNELRRRMASAWDLPVMKAGGRVALSDVKLTAQETRALNYFDGVRSLAMLARDAAAEAETIVRTAFLLHPLELVSFAATPVSSTPSPVPRSSPSQPGVPAASAPHPPPQGEVAAAPPRPPSQTGVSAVAPRPPSPGVAAAPPRVTAPPPAAAPPKVVAPPPQAAPPRVTAPPPAAMPPRAPAAPAFPGGAPPVVSQPSRPPTGPQPARPATGSFPTAPAAKPATGALPAAELTVPQLQQLLVKMKQQSFFEVLGLAKDADVNAVKVAYLKAARSYHPDTVPPGAPPELARVKADIFALIGEANRTLSDAKLREEYVAELAAGGTGSKVDVEKLFRAEERFQKGQILVKARKYADAVKMLDDAIIDNAEEPEFYAWRGYARFLGASDQKQVLPAVMRDLQHCTTKNPAVAAAWYFLGFVAKANGDLKAAKQHFQQTVKLDPKHIDAARELRTMK